jgi:beta-glucosidase
MKTPSPSDAVERRAITPAYKDADLPAEERVKDLLARMTLEEKAAQMMCVW